MSSIVVLGAGPIGAATAFQLASRGAARRIVLVDAAAGIAQGLALDMLQAGPITGSSTRLEGTSDTSAVIGAAVVVVADRHGVGEWTGEDGLGLVAAARAMNPRAPLVFAGAAAGGLIERVVGERDSDRRLLVGTAPEALRQGLRAIAALAAGVAGGDVDLTVVGRPPRECFVAWSGASIAGSPASDVLTVPELARLDAQATRLWPPGPLALGMAAAAVAERYLAAAPGVSSLWIVPPNDGLVLTRAVAVPATFGPAGAVPRWPQLAPRDRVRLDAAIRG